MCNYGISLLSINMIFFYLSNRANLSKIKECFSESSRIEHGVPRCSVLGPLPFNIDLIHLFYDRGKFNIATCAYDTTPCSCIYDTQTVISESKFISNKRFHWFQYNDNKANPGNCHLLLTNISIGDTSLTTTTKETLLGILIESELSFDQHVSSICSKANKKLHALGHIDSFISFGKRRTLMTQVP